MTPKSGILITGASSGIGKSCSLHLAKSGYLVFAGMRDVSRFTPTKNKIKGKIIPVMIDLCNPKTIEAAHSEIKNYAGNQGLLGLINNAGIAIPGPLECVEPQNIQQMICVNLSGLILTSKIFIPLLRQASGRIINIGSPSGRIGIPNLAVYSATKSALTTFTNALRLELQAFGIKVILIEPGNVKTPLWQKIFNEFDKVEASNNNEIQNLYINSMKGFQKSIISANERGISPNLVAVKVSKILSARKPKNLYLLGNESKFLAVITWLLPNIFLDPLIKTACGLSASINKKEL
jgi:short-subunit dehydrogenase